MRKSCNCDNGEVRCKSNCKGKETCELVSWFQEDPLDNVYKCQHISYTYCYGWGDPHIVTYDNAKTDVYGIAQYLMSGHDGTTDIPQFQVLMNTKKYNKVSAIEYMYTSFPLRSGELIEIETDRYGGANFYSTQHGWNKLYPQTTNDFTYKKWGRRHWMKNWFGLEIYQDGLFYIAKIPGFYDKETFGLCMNKNMDKIDDYTMKNGTQLPMPPQGGYKRTWQEYESATSWMTGCVELRGSLQYADGTEDSPEATCDGGPTMDDDLGCDPSIKDSVEAECEAMFSENWIKPCTDLIDPSQTITDCYIDYCMDKTTNTKLEVMSKFIDDCSKQLEPNDAVICDWPVLSGLSDPNCGANQIWKGCANACLDITECNEPTKDCSGDEELRPLCICTEGYVMSDGLCIVSASCPSLSATFSDWGTWTSCSQTCGGGIKSRTRICLAQACTGETQDNVVCNSCSCTSETVRHFQTPPEENEEDDDDENEGYIFVTFLWDDIDDIFLSVDGTDMIELTIGDPDEDIEEALQIVLGADGGTMSSIRVNDDIVKKWHTLSEFNEVICVTCCMCTNLQI